MFTITKATLESVENLKISGFGSFVLQWRSDRRGRNPPTGETITIDARRVSPFRASAVLRDAVKKQAVRDTVMVKQIEIRLLPETDGKIIRGHHNNYFPGGFSCSKIKIKTGSL